MDCKTVRNAVASGKDLSPEGIRHLEDCLHCEQALFARLPLPSPASAGTGSNAEMGALLAQTEVALAAEAGVLARLRSWPTRRRVVTAAAVSVVAVGGIALAAPRADLALYPALRMALILATFAVLLVATIQLALRPLYAPPPRRARWVGVIAAGLLAAVLFAGLPAAHWALDASQHGLGSELPKRAFGCFLFGLALAIPFIAALRSLDRGEHTSRNTALLAAAAGGIVGNLALQLHCPLTHPAHLLLGHATVGAVAIGSYALVRLALQRAR